MLTRAHDVDPVVAMDQLRLRVAAGAPADDLDTLPERCRRAVRVATAVGAPLLDALDGAQAAQDDLDKARRAVEVASAQTRAVAIGLLGAPLLLVPGLGRLVGADLLGFYTSGFGILVLAVAGIMLGLGAVLIVLLVRRVGRTAAATRRGSIVAVGAALVAGVLTWRLLLPALAPLAALLTHHLVDRRRTEPSPEGVDEAADLTATALAGGVSAPEALRIAADELPALAGRLRRLAFGIELGMGADDLRGGPPPAAAATRSTARDRDTGRPSRPVSAAATRAPGRPATSRAARGPAAARAPMVRRRPAPTDGLTRLVVVLTTAEEVGAPVAPTLRRLARDLRADDLALVLAAAERLPAQLTFPTALCLLPATVLLVGAPIVHTGLDAAGI